MEDKKEIILKALDYYDDYPKVQRKILKTLIEIAVDNMVIVTPTNLSKMAAVSRPSVYQTITILKNDEIIKSLADANKNKYKFIINIEKLSNILERTAIHQKLLTKG